MPLTSQMHAPKLMGEDDSYIRYGFPADEFDPEGHETKDTSDGVTVTMAKCKADGQFKVLSCAFPKATYDQKKAGAWLDAQKFSLEPADMHTVKGVEIFSTGLWNGKQINDGDLTAIVESFNSTRDKVRPFLKLGHDAEQKLLQSDGLPAAGWIENVRKVGSKLVADFVDIPKKVYQLIKNNAYRKVSCEIYNNIDIEGRKYPKLLGAVALLGADLPGVLNLNDILSMYSAPRFAGGIEKFAANGSAVIITSDITSQPTKERDMTEPTVEVYKAQLEQSQKDLAAKDAEIEKYKNQAADAQKQIAEAARAARNAQIDAFVTKLQSDKLCSKSMAPLVKQLLGEPVEHYTVGDNTKASREDVVTKLLTFSAEAAKVNFEETTTEGEGSGTSKNLDAEIEKYAAEHKVSFSAAYRAVTRGKDLSAQPL